MRAAKLIGGPLDGQEITRRGGRWPCYLDDDGQRISKAAVHRAGESNRATRFLTRFYRLERAYDPVTESKVVLYVHGSRAYEWHCGGGRDWCARNGLVPM